MAEDRGLTLPGKLASEISRVTELRCQYEDAQRRGGPSVNCSFAIAMITGALNHAVAAAGSPDIEGQIAALSLLEEFC
jgi:hypothetical protein